MQWHSVQFNSSTHFPLSGELSGERITHFESTMMLDLMSSIKGRFTTREQILFTETSSGSCFVFSLFFPDYQNLTFPS